MEGLPFLCKQRGEKLGHKMLPRRLAAYAHDCIVVRILTDPLNTKTEAGDGPSPASQFVSLPCPFPVDRGNLAVKSSLSPPKPYLWRSGELVGRSLRRLFQGRSSRIAGRGALGRTCLQLIVTRMPMCRDFRYSGPES